MHVEEVRRWLIHRMATRSLGMRWFDKAEMDKSRDLAALVDEVHDAGVIFTYGVASMIMLQVIHGKGQNSAKKSSVTENMKNIGMQSSPGVGKQGKRLKSLLQRCHQVAYEKHFIHVLKPTTQSDDEGSDETTQPERLHRGAINFGLPASYMEATRNEAVPEPTPNKECIQ